MTNARALSISTSITIILITVLTIAGELSESFLNFLKSLTFHHWFTKSVFSLIIFFLLYFAMRRTKDKNEPLKQARLVIWITIICALAISAFFFWNFFAK